MAGRRVCVCVVCVCVCGARVESNVRRGIVLWYCGPGAGGRTTVYHIIILRRATDCLLTPCPGSPLPPPFFYLCDRLRRRRWSCRSLLFLSAFCFSLSPSLSLSARIACLMMMFHSTNNHELSRFLAHQTREGETTPSCSCSLWFFKWIWRISLPPLVTRVRRVFKTVVTPHLQWLTLLMLLSRYDILLRTRVHGRFEGSKRAVCPAFEAIFRKPTFLKWSRQCSWRTNDDDESYCPLEKNTQYTCFRVYDKSFLY